MGDTLKGVIGILFDEDNERCAASTSTCRRWLRFKLLVLNLLVLSLNLVVEISSDDMALAWDETSKKGTFRWNLCFSQREVRMVCIRGLICIFNNDLHCKGIFNI
eukprot:443374_1